MIDHATTRETHGIWLMALGALTVLRLCLAATLPLAPDETYYWLWSLHLQPGYYDHPPMVALFIRLGTLAFGPTPLGIRLLCPLATAVGSLLLWRAAEDIFPNRHAGLIAAGLFNATLIAGAGSILITPDTPLLCFWSAALAGLGRLLATRDPRWWLGIGVAAGLALLSKYSGVILLAGIALWLIGTGPGRRSLKTPWPWAGLALAVLIFSPDIAWNARHHWVSYFKQGGRVAQFDPARSLQYLGELVLGQIGLVSPIIFALMAIGIWRLLRAHNQVAQLLCWLILLPAAVFLQHVVSGRVEANWPAVVYPAACIAAAGLPTAMLGRWLKPGLALGFLMTLLVYAQALIGIFPLPPARDPISLQLGGWTHFAGELFSRPAGFYTSDDYATAAELAYYAPAGTRIAGFGPRWDNFSFRPAGLGGSTGILVTRHADAACPLLLGSLTRNAADGPVTTYRLCRITAPGAGWALR